MYEQYDIVQQIKKKKATDDVETCFIALIVSNHL